MLCSLCTKLTATSIESLKHEIQHHTSYFALASAAASGCNLCEFFRTTTVTSYQRYHHCSPEAAEERQFQLDREDESNVECKRSVYFVKPYRIDSRDPETGLLGFEFLRHKPAVQDSYHEDAPFLTTCLSSDPSNDQVLGAEITVKPNLLTAKSWLEECVKTHSILCQQKRGHLPSRLIDVGTLEEPQDPCLVSSPGLYGDYVTLSHVWGKSKPLSTTSANYTNHLNRVPFHELPKTFRDAVEIVRVLQVRYLWIDSLCIVQDSIADWERECMKMSEYYKNSLVNLAGPAAIDSRAGLLHDRNFGINPAVEVDWQTLEYGRKLKLRLVYQRDPFSSPDEDSVLATRGWIYQELLLSHRILYFGGEMMYWECNSGLRYENKLNVHPAGSYSSPRALKMSFNTLREREHWLENWYETVYQYSNLELTVAIDRFPALSGLARRFQSKLGDKYVAGLWEKDIPRGLAWWVDSSSSILSCLITDDYIGPSWSWAAVGRQVRVQKKPLLDPDFCFLDHNIALAGQDDFGRLAEANISVYGRLVTGNIRYSGVRTSGFEIKSRHSITVGKYYPDDADPMSGLWLGRDPDDTVYEKKEGLFLCLGADVADETSGWEWWTAVAIEVIPGTCQQYRRVGCARGNYCMHPEARGWFENSDMKGIIDIA